MLLARSIPLRPLMQRPTKMHETSGKHIELVLHFLQQKSNLQLIHECFL